MSPRSNFGWLCCLFFSTVVETVDLTADEVPPPNRRLFLKKICFYCIICVGFEFWQLILNLCGNTYYCFLVTKCSAVSQLINFYIDKSVHRQKINMSHVFISKANRTDMPSNAVILTRREALEMQWSIIKNWKPKSDTWPFSIGLAVLGSVNAVTNLNIVKYFRHKLKLQNYGRLTMAMPTVLIPSILSVFIHSVYVTNEILLGSECPLCVQTRAAAAQVAVGAVIPLLSTPWAAFFYADAYNTFNVPKPSKQNLPKLFSLWILLLRKMHSKLPITIGVNAITASVLTYYEANSFYKIQSMIYENEEKFRRSIEERSL